MDRAAGIGAEEMFGVGKEDTEHPKSGEAERQVF